MSDLPLPTTHRNKWKEDSVGASFLLDCPGPLQWEREPVSTFGLASPVTWWGHLKY